VLINSATGVGKLILASRSGRPLTTAFPRPDSIGLPLISARAPPGPIFFGSMPSMVADGLHFTGVSKVYRIYGAPRDRLWEAVTGGPGTPRFTLSGTSPAGWRRAPFSV